jgi:phospholipid/cholesterol/gamma-HCH transport system ATP-binding protein
MIEVKNLYKSFGEKGVLSDISFSLPHGHAVAIVGKSGAGKSVLLKCLIGLLKPDDGTIYVDNKLINSMSFRQLQEIRASIGMVFQFGALFDSLTVSENISLALRKLTKLSEDEIQERVIHSLDSVDMAGTEELMPAELSGGMKKRVGIARAIAIKPAYLFYDEPTTGLDPVMTDSINRLIKKFQSTEKVTSVIITHEMRTVYDVADRVLLLHDGKIRFDGNPDEIKNVDDPVVKQFITGNSKLAI